MTVSVKDQKDNGRAAGGTLPPAPPGLVARLASVRLTLWLVALLTLAMIVASFFPQNVPEEEYQRAFGLLGKWLSRSILTHMYGSWPFIGCFILLAVNLLACAIQRTGQLLNQDRALPVRLTRAEVESRTWRARWKLAAAPEAAAQQVMEGLRGLGYAVSEVAGEDKEQYGIIARRGRLQSWLPVIVHVGLVIVLIGAAWGRLPRNTFRDSVRLGPGEEHPVQVAGEAFGLRLLDAGAKYSPTGRPTDFWAKVEVLEEGTVVERMTVRPNTPLRYHGVSMTLANILSGGYGVGVTKGSEHVVVPVVASPDGTVNVQQSYALLEGEPHWIVVAEALRDRDEQGHPGVAAMVEMGQMSQAGHSFKSVGWVDEKGVTQGDLHFRLVESSSGAELSLDRDIGIPIVFLGFITVAMGTLLLLSSPRRSSLAALVGPRGKSTQVTVGVYHSGGSTEADKLLRKLESELEATREVESQTKGDVQA